MTSSATASSASPGGGSPYSSGLLAEALAGSELSGVEEGIAWFEVTFGCLFLAAGTAVLARFFHVRDVFEIKARSPRLVMLNALSLLGILGVVVYQAGFMLDPTLHLNVLDIYVALYFVSFSFYAGFWARVVRLGLAYCPRLKKKFPWLMSENLLVAVSVLIGGASVPIPLYYWSTFHGPLADWEFAIDQEDKLALCQWILLGITLLCIPIVWRVDDLFRISREMLCVVVLQLIQNGVVKMADYADNPTSAWVTRLNIAFVSSILLIVVIVIDPIRRLAFNPMSKTYPAFARAQDRRRQHGLRALNKNDLSELTEPDSFQDSGSASASATDTSTPRRRKWSYESLAAQPGMAAAFRAFAFRALCQESVLFLEDIVRYQHGDFSMCGDTENRCQRAAFLAIVGRFIADGSVDEVNISWADKRKISGLTRNEAEQFDMLDEDQKRTVFGKAYVEIRYMLEANLLKRFMETPEFKVQEARTPPPPTRRRKRGNGSNKKFDIEAAYGCLAKASEPERRSESEGASAGAP